MGALAARIAMDEARPVTDLEEIAR